MQSLNPFNYSLAEVRKMLVAFAGFAGFAILFLIKKDFDPGLVESIQTLVPAAIAVLAVFGVANATADDYNKAFTGAIYAGVAVWQYFGTVDEGTVESLLILAGYAATFFTVAKTANKPPLDGQRATATSTPIGGPGRLT